MTPTLGTITPKFALSRHSKILQSACGGVLDEEQLAFVVAANLVQDIRQFESQVHFDNCAFAEGIYYIGSEWDSIDSESDRLSRASLCAFGRLLHTVQDFYAHSNWVELHLDEDPIPLWNFNGRSLPTGIVSGTWPIGEPKRCAAETPHHDELCKDEPDSPTGEQVVDCGPHAGKTLYEIAEAVAIRATRIQLERLMGETIASKDVSPLASKKAAIAGADMFLSILDALRKEIEVQKARI